MHFGNRQTHRHSRHNQDMWYFWILPFTSRLHLSISILFIHIFSCVIWNKRKKTIPIARRRNAPKLKMMIEWSAVCAGCLWSSWVLHFFIAFIIIYLLFITIFLFSLSSSLSVLRCPLNWWCTTLDKNVWGKREGDRHMNLKRIARARSLALFIQTLKNIVIWIMDAMEMKVNKNLIEIHFR